MYFAWQLYQPASLPARAGVSGEDFNWVIRYTDTIFKVNFDAECMTCALWFNEIRPPYCSAESRICVSRIYKCTIPTVKLWLLQSILGLPTSYQCIDI